MCIYNQLQITNKQLLKTKKREREGKNRVVKV